MVPAVQQRPAGDIKNPCVSVNWRTFGEPPSLGVSVVRRPSGQGPCASGRSSRKGVPSWYRPRR